MGEDVTFSAGITVGSATAAAVGRTTAGWSAGSADAAADTGGGGLIRAETAGERPRRPGDREAVVAVSVTGVVDRRALSPPARVTVSAVAAARGLVAPAVGPAVREVRAPPAEPRVGPAVVAWPAAES